MEQPFSPDDLARRRRDASRLATIIGAVVLALYIVGLFIKR